MQIRDLYKLSSMELEFVIRAAEAKETMEYLNMLGKTGMIAEERLGNAMYAAMSVREDPNMMIVAGKVLEEKKAQEFTEYYTRNYQSATGKTPEAAAASAKSELKKQAEAEKEEAVSEELRANALLTALKCAVDVAVYRAKAAMASINNSILKRSVKALAQCQQELATFEALKSESQGIKKSIVTIQNAAPLPPRGAYRDTSLVTVKTVVEEKSSSPVEYRSGDLFTVRSAEDVKNAVKHGADVNAAKENGETPLFRYRNNASIVKALIDAGANVNAFDVHGDTPLHLVKDEDSAKLLIDAGADVNALNSRGLTPRDTSLREAVDNLIYAAGGRSSEEIIEGEEEEFEPETFEEYILSKIDLSERKDEIDANISQPSNAYAIFRAEKKEEIESKGELKACREWLSGMASVLPVDFEEAAQREILKKYDLPLKNDSDVSETFYTAAAKEFLKIAKAARIEEEKSDPLSDSYVSAPVPKGKPEEERKESEASL